MKPLPKKLTDDSLVTKTVRVRALAWVYADLEVTVPNDAQSDYGAEMEARFMTDRIEFADEVTLDGIHEITSVEVL